MKPDFLLLFLTFITSVLGAFLYTKILRNDIPLLFAYLSGAIQTTLWLFLLKTSRMSVIGVSAWFDAIAALGYFVGFFLLGSAISSTQFVGILFLLIGLYLIN